MKTSSAKAKGRRFQQEVRDRIQKAFNLSELDVRSNPMGNQGEDIMMSSAAIEKFPFMIECKAVEKVNIWQAWQQANHHVFASKREDVHPLVCIKRSRARPLAILDLDVLLELLGGKDD